MNLEINFLQILRPDIELLNWINDLNCIYKLSLLSNDSRPNLEYFFHFPFSGFRDSYKYDFSIKIYVINRAFFLGHFTLSNLKTKSN